MKKYFVIILSLYLFVLACKKNEVESQKTAPQYSDEVTKPQTTEIKNQYKSYMGSWFKILYPENFTAKGSLKSTTSDEGFDSAVFTSPDGKVQFYVFSPQWSGEAKDISLQPNEKLLENTEENKNTVLVKRWTIVAKDGSYTRSYEERIELENNINTIFGIRYSSRFDLEKYKAEYLQFKSSLKQFAD